MSFLGPFEHTTGKTWGGVQIGPTTLQVSSVLGGFFGLDHFLLRSPKTGLLKFIVNIFTLGFWYLYDLVQVFTDIESVEIYGYTIPIVGPVGLGAGIVGDTAGPKAAKEGTPSPWAFLAYVLLTTVPFGFSHLIAGDMNGATAKFVMTVFFLTTIFGILWAAYSFFYAVFNTQDLLTKGVDRFFPATFFMDPYGPSPNLIPPLVEKAQIKELGLIDWIYNTFFCPLQKPALEAVVGITEPLVKTAEEVKDAVAATQTGGALLQAIQKGEATDGISKYVFLGTAAVICLGSVFMTYARFWNAKKDPSFKHSEKNDLPPEGFQDDVPPGPRVF